MTIQRFAVLGKPVSHSKSPLMMRAAFSEMGLKATYEAIEVKETELKEKLEELLAGGYRGFNITIPHKQRIIPYLDWLEETALAVGAVNTVVVRNGALIGMNTDVDGYIQALKEETALDFSKQTVLIWGAGGAARAVAYGLLRAGVLKIYLNNRTDERAVQLAKELRQYGEIEAISKEKCAQLMKSITLVVQTTPVGMKGYQSQIPIPPDWIAPHHIVSDLIYIPMVTPLLQAAREKGATIHNGLGMLVHQGALALQHWTGQTAPIKTMRSALERSLMGAES